MSRVVIIAVGSRGDVAPLTGVGVALQQAGHTVSIAAYTPFAAMIRRALAEQIVAKPTSVNNSWTPRYSQIN